jgi:hypothetical protein
MDTTKDFTGSTNDRSVRDTSAEPKHEDGQARVDEDALQAAIGFYEMFTSACHGITRRQELDQLYNATYLSFGSKHETRPEFSKVLFAMAREMKVLKVIRGGTISWNAFNRRDDHHHDRRPRFDDRNGRDERRDDHHHDRRPRFDDRRGRDGPSSYYGNARQDHHHRDDNSTRGTRAVSVERQ